MGESEHGDIHFVGETKMICSKMRILGLRMKLDKRRGYETRSFNIHMNTAVFAHAASTSSRVIASKTSVTLQYCPCLTFCIRRTAISMASLTSPAYFLSSDLPPSRNLYTHIPTKPFSYPFLLEITGPILPHYIDAHFFPELPENHTCTWG